ncbi:hypothetical protein AOLI_G00279000 [Acnodon oligacanthus]
MKDPECVTELPYSVRALAQREDEKSQVTQEENITARFTERNEQRDQGRRLGRKCASVQRATRSVVFSLGTHWKENKSHSEGRSLALTPTIKAHIPVKWTAATNWRLREARKSKLRKQ